MMKLTVLVAMVVAAVMGAPAPKAGVALGVLPLAARSIHPSPLAFPAVPALSAPFVAAPVAPVAAVATAHSSQAVARTYNAAITVPAAVPALHAAYAYSSPYAYAPAYAPAFPAVAPTFVL